MIKNHKYTFYPFSFLLSTSILFTLSTINKFNNTKNEIEQRNSYKITSEVNETAVNYHHTIMDKIQSHTDTKLISIQTEWVTEQILESNDGEIHYSYYLPKGYNEEKNYPMMVVMPGYDMMWFGEKSSRANLSWRGLLSWTELNKDMIVVSVQLTDWHEKSARQSVELTEYFIENFAVDKNRVYAAGYSAGGETMSQAVSMRPDLYAAYLHGASQWDGTYDSIAKNGTAVYILL